ncbi:glycosyltransferase [Ideonella sp.]|jgi:glycosyltransferase involved in cell wall biosynthesis|uniref:glycosyltransferase n=1 Tax=Ideonella sp. TaxID=1929293 RepID=UPI0037BFD721
MLRLVLMGDGDSPHLLKWARALRGQVDLWALSSRGFAPGFDEIIPSAQRLALGTQPNFEGGNVGLLRALPTVVRWLKAAQPDWLAPHYLSSHGTLAWLALRCGVKARMVGSAWGSDILVTPQGSALMRWVTGRVLRACALSTSDSAHMTLRMQALGAGEVMTFPFGLELMPPAPMPGQRDEALFFANRGLEPIYAPERVLAVFAQLAAQWPEARLVVANSGSLATALQAQATQAGLGERVQFVGRLSAAEQARFYAQARWYLSLPQSDSVSVSVLEAMAYGAIPILSDLPANRELVQDGVNGLILGAGAVLSPSQLQPLALRGDEISLGLHRWVAEHALFPQAVASYVQRLQALK